MAATSALADMLNEEMPKLPEQEPDAVFSNVVVDMTNPYKDAEFVGCEQTLFCC
jgi:hypothetical protein